MHVLVQPSRGVRQVLRDVGRLSGVACGSCKSCAQWDVGTSDVWVLWPSFQLQKNWSMWVITIKLYRVYPNSTMSWYNRFYSYLFKSSPAKDMWLHMSYMYINHSALKIYGHAWDIAFPSCRTSCSSVPSGNLYFCSRVCFYILSTGSWFHSEDQSKGF